MDARRQTGAVLIVSLLLLIAMTLLGVITINSSTVSLRVVGNLQAQQAAEAAAQEAIELVLNDAANFSITGAPSQMTVSDGTVITIERLECREQELAPGYSAAMALAPVDTAWWVTAAHTNAEGGRATVHQGVKMRMTADSCS